MSNLVNAPTRLYRTAIVDSQRWEGFKPRPDDIIVATFPKCGTTWTQRIVDLLLFSVSGARPFLDTAPWLDATFFRPVETDLANLESQTRRRTMKSHLPLDSLPVYEGAKVIHVGRDGRDACLSMHNHMLGMLPERLQAQAVRAAEAGLPLGAQRAETPEDPRQFYLDWIAAAETYEGAPGVGLPFFEFENTYWRRRAEPRLLLVHYNDLKADLAGEMRRISEFLGIDTPPSLLPELAEAARFETMKRQGEEMLPGLKMGFDHGADRFLNKGTNDRWKAFLSPDDVARYEALARRRFAPALASWIEHGRLIAGDPRDLADKQGAATH